MTAPEAPTKHRLFLKSGNGVAILYAACRVAAKAGWSLDEWLKFNRKARSLEWEEMLALVCTRFDVHMHPKFSKDPVNWRPEESQPEELILTPDE